VWGAPFFAVFEGRETDAARSARFHESDAIQLTETCASKCLPEIRAFHLHDAAHFVKPRTHALTDAVAESLAAGGPMGARKI
jgi:hypothetical protein